MSELQVEDAGWKAIFADERLTRARSKLSIHELRLIIDHARASSCSRCRYLDEHFKAPLEDMAKYQKRLRP